MFPFVFSNNSKFAGPEMRELESLECQPSLKPWNQGTAPSTNTPKKYHTKEMMQVHSGQVIKHGDGRSC